MEVKYSSSKVNHDRDINAILNNYEQEIKHEFWFFDGLQKDAIQNCWDARIDKKHAKEWACEFSLIRDKENSYLVIEDFGTNGLSGEIFLDDEDLERILNLGRPDDNLVNFLNSNWSSKADEDGGNRGRGKNLIIAASKERRLIFDSLRPADNIYVSGEIFVNSNKQINFCLNKNDKGKIFLNEKIGTLLKPKDSFGTRIVIMEPHDEIVKAIEAGCADELIGSAWWEIISKFNVNIYIVNKEKRRISLPICYSEESLKGMISPEKSFENDTIDSNLRIKRLKLFYSNNNEISPRFSGIAIQRGGMTIERINPGDLVKEEGVGNIFGWIEMDYNLEKEMKTRCENPEHFSFRWNTKPAKYLREYIQTKIRIFAKQLFLLEEEKRSKNKIFQDAEKKAIKNLSLLLKKIKSKGKGGHIKASRQTHTRKDNEMIRLSVPNIDFIRENRRLNYGETIKNSNVFVINESNIAINTLLRVFVIDEKQNSKVLYEENVVSEAHSTKCCGKANIAIDKSIFQEKGKYILRAKLISKEDSDFLINGNRIEKGFVLYDRIYKNFYVEVDPPEEGPFKFWPENKDNKSSLTRCELEEDGSYIIFYNQQHPTIKNLQKDVEALSKFLTEQGAWHAINILFNNAEIADADSDQDFAKVKEGNDYSLIWPLFISKYSEFMWEINQ